MLKTLLSTIAAISLTGTSFVNFSYIATKDESSNSLNEFLKKDIEENKIYLGKQNFIKYDDQKFATENDLKNYFMTNSVIESQFTSSNPYKIIKDYSTMILDESQIYDLNINNFDQVYRNAYGRVTETSVKALNTYANVNFTKEKYSYDSVTWWDSPEEAKINQKDNLTIQKSLYYRKDGEFFNAFNPTDIDALLNRLDDGYYVNKTKNLSGEALDEPFVTWGDEEILSGLFKTKIKTEFLTDYFPKISKMEVTNRLIVTPTYDNEFRVDFHDGNKPIINKQPTPFTIEFAQSNKFHSYKEMLADFKNTAKWSEKAEKDSGSTRHYRERDFNIVNPKNGKTTNATIKLLPEWPNWLGETWVSLDSYHYEDSTSANVLTYGDETKTGEPVITTKDLTRNESDLNLAYDLTMISEEQKEKLFAVWIDKYYIPNKVTKFTIKQDFNYKDLKNGDYIKNVDQDVYKDKLFSLNFGRGKDLSVIDSFLDYQKKKKEILEAEPIIEDGVEKYPLFKDLGFYATKEQLDNYLSLGGNTFEPEIMYAVGSEENPTSRDGSLLRPTMQEAKELAFLLSNPSLKKKYIASDISGEVQAEGSTREAAMTAVHNRIKLESKLVNKQEIKTWDWDLPISYDKIVSDGKYIVYKLKDEVSKTYIYFPTEELVLKAAMSSAKENGDINNVYMEKYLYTYFDSTSQKQISVIFYDDDIDSAISQVLDQINQNQSGFNNVLESKKDIVYGFKH